MPRAIDIVIGNPDSARRTAFMNLGSGTAIRHRAGDACRGRRLGMAAKYYIGIGKYQEDCKSGTDE